MSNKSRRNNPGRAATSDRTRSNRGPARPAARPVQGSAARRRLERMSAPWLITLHRMPRFVVPVGMAAVLFLGLLLAGTWAWLGGLLLGIVTLFVVWLTALSWPVLTGSSRLVRVVIVAALAGITVLKLLGKW